MLFRGQILPNHDISTAVLPHSPATVGGGKIDHGETFGIKWEESFLIKISNLPSLNFLDCERGQSYFLFCRCHFQEMKVLKKEKRETLGM